MAENKAVFKETLENLSNLCGESIQGIWLV